MYQFKKNKIRRLMFEKNLTQDELAKVLNISRVSLNRLLINKHKTRLDTGLDLAKVLEVSIYDIIQEI